MKPRIRLIRQKHNPFHYWWRCEGSSTVGFGYTPEAAYGNWCYYCNMKKEYRE